MTENLLQKLEEKVVILLADVENLRKELQRANHENAALKIERENNARKLQDLIEMLDSVNSVEVPPLRVNLAAVESLVAENA